MKTFTINGKEYKARILDFNAACDLEDFGVSLTEMDGRNLSLIRAYFALCCGKGKEYAGQEIENHCISGGKMDELSEIVNWAVKESGFFQSVSKAEKTDNPENQEAASE